MANKVLTDEEKTNLYKNTSSTKAGKNDINKLGGLTNPNLRSSNNLSNNDNNTPIQGKIDVNSAQNAVNKPSLLPPNTLNNAPNVAANGTNSTNSVPNLYKNTTTTPPTTLKAVTNPTNKTDLWEKRATPNADLSNSDKDVAINPNVPQTAGDIINADKTAMNDKLKGGSIDENGNTLSADETKLAKENKPYEHFTDAVRQRYAGLFENDEQRAKREKRERARETIASISDALAGIGNLVGAARGATPMKMDSSYAGVLNAEKKNADNRRALLARYNQDMSNADRYNLNFSQNLQLQRYRQQLLDERRAGLISEEKMKEQLNEAKMIMLKAQAENERNKYNFQASENQKNRNSRETIAKGRNAVSTANSIRSSSTSTSNNIRNNKTRLKTNENTVKGANYRAANYGNNNGGSSHFSLPNISVKSGGDKSHVKSLGL